MFADDSEREEDDDDDDDEDDDDQNDADGDKMGHLVEIGETIEELYKSGEEIKWASGGAQVKFDENNIIRGDEAMKIAGVNNDPNAAMQVQGSKILGWHMQFEEEDIIAAKENLGDIMRVWKHYQNPKLVLHRVLMTHQVNVVSGANRKTLIPSLALVMARESAGKPLVAAPAD